MHAVRLSVCLSVCLSEDFPWSDLHQIWYAASFHDPKQRPVTAFSIRAPGAQLEAKRVLRASRRISASERHSKACKGIFRTAATGLSEWHRFRVDPSKKVVLQVQQGLLRVEQDLGFGAVSLGM